ncbi:Putative colanic biosynthesis UDP-glucose lipid carrier transferase [Turicibacter sanguinis]|nr:Putative colanic biosynthesis UDP-glucose lipid carrier transferase [Turicibacter sanguinis]
MEALSSECYESYFLEQLSHSKWHHLNEKKLYFKMKRGIDIIISIIGLIIGTPFILIFGLLIFLESPGTIIFKQQRVGKNGQIFTLYKLRSMRLDAEKYGQKWADKNDSRVLRVGKFIRKTRIDELPQLINILKGEMTLIGPRPEIPKFTLEFNEKYPGFVNRIKVTPGLTGLAQVSGGYDMEPNEKLEKDLEYIQKQSIKLDLIIIIKTISVIFTGAGAR